MYKVYMAKATCNRISLLCDSPILGALNFCPFHWNLKGNYILRKVNSKEKNIYMWNQYYYFYLPKIKVGRANTTKIEVTFA